MSVRAILMQLILLAIILGSGCDDTWYCLYGAANEGTGVCGGGGSGGGVTPDSGGSGGRKTTVSGCFLKDSTICLYTNFSSQDLSGARLSNATLTGSNFTGANLQRVNFADAVLTGAIFDGANLTSADISRAKFNPGFRYLDLYSQQFPTSFVNANLSAVTGASAQFVQAVLSGALLKDSRLSAADFTDAVIDVGSDGRRPDFTGAVFEQAKFIRARINQPILTRANFKDADLTRAVITGATADVLNMNGAILTDASFTDSQIGGATGDLSNFTSMRAIRTNFSGTAFIRTDFSHSDMRCTVFNRGKLIDVDFQLTDLTGAVLGEDNGPNKVEISPRVDIEQAILCHTTINGQLQGNNDPGCDLTPPDCATLK